MVQLGFLKIVRGENVSCLLGGRYGTYVCTLLACSMSEQHSQQKRVLIPFVPNEFQSVNEGS